MRKLRGIIIGMLLFAGAIYAAEHYLCTHQDVASQLQKKRDPFLGWEPSDSLYLIPPVSKTIKSFTQASTSIFIRYDAQGFRIAAKPPTQKNHLLFLGDESTLAVNLKAEHTFIHTWQQAQDKHLKQFSLRSGRFINAAQPFGCPLLWLLQDSTRFSQINTQFVLCVIDAKTLQNDFQVRRTITFDGQGMPISGDHPYTRAEQSAQPTQIDSLLQSQLLNLGIAKLRELFLSNAASGTNFNSQTKQRTELLASAERETLARLALEPLVKLRESIRSRGSEMILVYLPDADELRAVQAEKTKTGLPVILTTQNQPEQTKQIEWSYRQLVQNFANQQNIRLCDATARLSQQPQGTIHELNDASLLSATGHQIVAEILMDFFSTQTVQGNRNINQ